uniref:T3-ars protein n=1 Tax=Nicotiana tabacum TaxID=4097 RepID=V9GZY0_TOBAC|nr:hypothetical protein t3-ars - common tobacco [Nicotiana tabacum]AAA66307.1 putative [Nicotiana tabacum]
MEDYLLLRTIFIVIKFYNYKFIIVLNLHSSRCMQNNIIYFVLHLR